ncbi:hypothetical protein ABRT01_06035 [Lentibacillus sp. L22]|uniref:hypothetical protein n=1 Tax=Lentibacillus TaxID=175304 RepID=UPI0022B1E437|nr:hypothetical protein [Lentibacillus daqui]
MYHIEEITLKNGPKERKDLVIRFDDPNMQIVGEFLMADASLLDAAVLDEIDQVLSGETKVIKSSGNRCSLVIKADKTLIEDLFGDFDGVDTLPSYAIDTRKLRELIVMWLNKLQEFKSGNRWRD